MNRGNGSNEKENGAWDGDEDGGKKARSGDREKAYVTHKR